MQNPLRTSKKKIGSEIMYEMRRQGMTNNAIAKNLGVAVSTVYQHIKAVFEACEAAPRHARFVLPNACETKIMMTMNARELHHFFALRMCNRAQWEIRRMADEMYRQARNVAPMLFAKAGPGCWNSGCPEARPCKKPRDKF